ncbi:MAG: 2TM domain-containing protein [Caldilineaceae bacterium]
MNKQKAHERIEKRVEEKLGFYTHLAVYILVNGLLIAINLITSPETYWFIWPLIGWGIAVAIHALGVFVFDEGAALKKRMLEDEMRKEGLKL